MTGLKRLIAMIVATIAAVVGSFFTPWVYISLAPIAIALSAVFLLSIAALERLKNLNARPLTKQVIVVDDDAVALLSIKSIFQSMGYKVKTYMNPLTALAELNREKFDFAVVDHMMPELSGEEFLLRLDNQYRSRFSRKPTAIMFTGHPEDVYLKQSQFQHINYRGILPKNEMALPKLRSIFKSGLSIAS